MDQINDFDRLVGATGDDSIYFFGNLVEYLFRETMKYCDMNNTEIREITYEQCPLKCTGCEALCNEMPINQCRKNLSQAFDQEC